MNAAAQSKSPIRRRTFQHARHAATNAHGAPWYADPSLTLNAYVASCVRAGYAPHARYEYSCDTERLGRMPGGVHGGRRGGLRGRPYPACGGRVIIYNKKLRARDAALYNQ